MSLALELQPIDWVTIRSTIYDWAHDLLGVDVIWANHNIPQPPYPYVTLNVISGPNKQGGVDELRTTCDLTRPAGQEIEMVTTDQVTFTVSIIAHINNDAFIERPECDALILASKLQASLGQRGVLDTFNDLATCSVVSWTGPTDVSIVSNGEWIRRSNLDIVFGTVSVMTEYAGYIDKVEIVSDILGIDEVIDGS